MEKRSSRIVMQLVFLYITTSHSSGCYFTARCSVHPDHPDEGERACIEILIVIFRLSVFDARLEELVRTQSLGCLFFRLKKLHLTRTRGVHTTQRRTSNHLDEGDWLEPDEK